MLILKASLVWCALVFCAIINGILREKLLRQFFRQRESLIISGILLCVWIFLLCYFVLDSFTKQSLWVYLAIGIFWVALTLVFEFLFGHYVMKKPWPELFKVFDIASGDCFLLALATTALAPVLVAYLHNNII